MSNKRREELLKARFPEFFKLSQELGDALEAVQQDLEDKLDKLEEIQEKLEEVEELKSEVGV